MDQKSIDTRLGEEPRCRAASPNHPYAVHTGPAVIGTGSFRRPSTALSGFGWCVCRPLANGYNGCPTATDSSFRKASRLLQCDQARLPRE